MDHVYFVKNTKSSKILDVLANANIRSVYLLNCSWMSNDSETTELFKMLGKQELNKVRVIGSSLNEFYILTLASRLLSNNSSVNMLVYDPTMSDQTADDISSFILSSYKDASGVVLIVSRNKIQGIVNTCSLTSELSALERFNLSMYVRHLNSKLCTWKEHLESQVHNKEFIFTFIKLLYKTDFNWKLKITLWENDILIVHRKEFENLDEYIYLTNNVSVVYLSSCNINELEYDFINEKCSTLHILNSSDCVQLLHAKLLLKQSIPNKLFIYGNIKYTLLNSLIEFLSRDHLNISAVLAANGMIVGIHPSNELIALAFQLQPSPTTWILSTTDNISILYQVIDALTILPTEWTELDFTGCNIGDIECDIMYRIFRCKRHSTVRKLNISLSRLSISGICDLVNIVIICGIKKLNINGTNDVLLDQFNNNLTFKQHNDMFLSITYNHKVLQIICNISLNKITTKLNTQASELHIVNCKEQLNSTEFTNYLHMTYKLLRLCIINCSISEAVVTEIIQIFLNRNIELTLSDDRIIDDNGMLRNLLTSREFFCKLKLNFLLSTDHWLFVYNTTKYQLQFINKYFINQALPNSYAMTRVIRHLEISYGDKMYSFEKDVLNVVRFHAKAFQPASATRVIAALSNSTSLNIIEIENYNIITDEAADDLAAAIHCNTLLQELDVSGNDLRTEGVIKIAVALQSIVTLTKLNISNNNITSTAANAIAVAIAHNTHLQEFIISGNGLGVLGAKMIARSLQKISTLTKLHIANTNISDEAVDDIAAVVSCNVYLQEFDISGNCLQAIGAAKIARGLQEISTLTKLYISNNKITYEAADEIAAAVSCNSELQDIDISENDLETIGIIKIMKALQGIHTLKVLYLNSNNITDKAADDIAAAICCNTKLEELDVSRNDLRTEGVIKIAVALQRIVTLTKLNLSNNNVTYTAVNAIAVAITRNTHLQELIISGNYLGGVLGAKIIAKSLQTISTLTKLYIAGINNSDGATDDIAAAVSCNVHLQEFDIGKNYLDALSVIKVAKSLQEISTLTKLCINNNQIANEAAHYIANVISCNSHLQILDISSNNLQQVQGASII